MTTFKVGDRVRITGHPHGCHGWYVGKTAVVVLPAASTNPYVPLTDLEEVISNLPHIFIKIDDLFPGTNSPINIYWPVTSLELVTNEESPVNDDAHKKTYSELQPEPPLELDDFHYHEALDRLHMLLVMAEESLDQHPVMLKHPALNDLYCEIYEKLGQLYQDIANSRPGEE